MHSAETLRVYLSTASRIHTVYTHMSSISIICVSWLVCLCSSCLKLRLVERLIVTIVWWGCHVSTSARLAKLRDQGFPFCSIHELSTQISIVSMFHHRCCSIYTKKVYLAFTEREHTRWTRDYTSPKQELNFFEGWELQEQWMSNGVWRSVCTQVYDWILEGKNPLLFDFSAFFSQVHIASPWLMWCCCCFWPWCVHHC